MGKVGLWAVKPSLFGKHNNPFEGASDPFKIASAMHRKGVRVRYEDYLSKMAEEGVDVKALQESDLLRVEIERRRYALILGAAILFIAITLKFLMNIFGPTSFIIFGGPALTLVGGYLIADRNVVMVKQGRYVSFGRYLAQRLMLR